MPEPVRSFPLSLACIVVVLWDKMTLTAVAQRRSARILAQNFVVDCAAPDKSVCSVGKEVSTVYAKIFRFDHFFQKIFISILQKNRRGGVMPALRFFCIYNVLFFYVFFSNCWIDFLGYF